MVFCSVDGCYSNDKFGEKRTFYKFPVRSYDRNVLWHEFCSDKEKKLSTCGKKYVCDLHFLDSDFDSHKRLFLKTTAIPSINGPNSILKKPDMIASIFKSNMNLNRSQITPDARHNTKLAQEPSQFTENSESGLSIVECISLASSPCKDFFNDFSKGPSQNHDEHNRCTDIDETSEKLEETSEKPKKKLEKPQHSPEKPHQIFQKRFQALKKSQQAIIKRYQPIPPQSKSDKVHKKGVSHGKDLEKSVHYETLSSSQGKSLRTDSVNSQEVNNNPKVVNSSHQDVQDDDVLKYLEIDMDSSVSLVSDDENITPVTVDYPSSKPVKDQYLEMLESGGKRKRVEYPIPFPEKDSYLEKLESSMKRKRVCSPSPIPEKHPYLEKSECGANRKEMFDCSVEVGEFDKEPIYLPKEHLLKSPPASPLEERPVEEEPIKENPVEGEPIREEPVEEEIESTITVSRPRINPLKNELDKINEFRKKRLVKQYKRNTNKKRILGINLEEHERNAMSALNGEFNTFFQSTIEHVDLEAGEWHKLYTPSVVNLQKMPEILIGPIVNQLKAKLPTLNNREQLEVSFLLSLMSVYPQVPKHIKELMFQRLNLVYIATMFKWDTAITLCTSEENKPTRISNLNNSSDFSFAFKNNASNLSKSNSGFSHGVFDPRAENSSNSCFASPDNIFANTVSTKSQKRNRLEKSRKYLKKEKSTKQSSFAFEVIVQEKTPDTKECDENSHAVRSRYDTKLEPTS